MPEEVKEVEFAFAILKDKNGNLNIGTIDNPGLKQRIQPNMEDIYAALIVITKDLEAQKMAAKTLEALNLVAQKAQQQNGPDQSGLIVPEPSSKFEKVVRDRNG